MVGADRSSSHPLTPPPLYLLYINIFLLSCGVEILLVLSRHYPLPSALGIQRHRGSDQIPQKNGLTLADGISGAELRAIEVGGALFWIRHLGETLSVVADFLG